MSNEKTALVMEGGGLRGAFTAGCLTWLIDNGITFDGAYGISTGAMYLTAFLMGNKDELYDFSVNGLNDKRYIGIRALLRCRRIVDYDYLFNQMLTVEKGYDLQPLKTVPQEGRIGLYDMDEARTLYFSTRDFVLDMLKASTTLPIIGKVVPVNGRRYLDGGITDMIPIEEAVKDGYEKFLIITTKPADYVRKPAKKAIVELMKVSYPCCKQISEDYAVRHLNYEKQIALIRKLEADGRALYVYPLRHSKVTRLGGKAEDLAELFHMGYDQMEENRETVFADFKNV